MRRTCWQEATIVAAGSWEHVVGVALSVSYGLRKARTPTLVYSLHCQCLSALRAVQLENSIQTTLWLPPPHNSFISFMRMGVLANCMLM